MVTSKWREIGAGRDFGAGAGKQGTPCYHERSASQSAPLPALGLAPDRELSKLNFIQPLFNCTQPMTDATPTPSGKAVDLRQWHRLFGIALMETFAGLPWRVELEQELALRSQQLDVAIIESTSEGVVAHPPAGPQTDLAWDMNPGQASDPVRELPDGLENLRPHNLLTYKSRHEALDAWALDELIGHYVNYRKLRLDAEGKRHPPDAFGLYAVATRFPQGLMRQHALQQTAWEGVYEFPWGGQQIRLIVLNAIAQQPRNAAWELFASERDRMQQGLEHYRARHANTDHDGHWELLERLHLIYQRENLDMAYTMEDFLRETHEMVLAKMTPEERLRGLDAEDRLRGLDAEERLRGLDAEERLRGLDAEERLRGLDAEERLRGLDAEERLKGLDPAVIEAWLSRHRKRH